MIRKFFIAAISLSSMLMGINIVQSPAAAYSVNFGGDITLHRFNDVGRELDPIVSTSLYAAEYPFEITLTLESSDLEVRSGNTFASFTLEIVNNTVDKKLNFFRVNSRNHFFDGFSGGVAAGQSGTFNNVSLKVREYANDEIGLNNIKAGWWSDTFDSFGNIGDYTTDTVPEPGTVIGTLLAGAAGLKLWQQRQKDKDQTKAS